MRVEHGRIQAVILRLRIAAHRLFVGQRLEAELAAKPGRTAAVIVQRLKPVPHRPEMRVADAVALHVPALPGAAGRSGDVGRVAVESRHPFRQNAVEKLLVPAHGFRIRRPEITHGFDLVVAAPNRKTCVFTHTFYVEKHLFLHIGKEIRLVERIGHAREHEVLPHHYPEAVAKVEELVGSVISAAPYADHVEIALRRRAHVIFEFLLIRTRVEAVERDEVRALAEHLPPVHRKCEIAAVSVRTPVEHYGAEPDIFLLFTHDAALVLYAHGALVQRLLAPRSHAVGPPQLRAVDGETEREIVRVSALQFRHAPVGGAQYGYCRKVHAVVQHLGRHVETQRHRAAVMCLMHRKFRDLRAAAEIDVNVARDPARRKYGTPIPPEMALGFAYAVYAVYAVRVRRSAEKFALFGNVIHGRGDDDLDLIPPRFQELLYVEFVTDMAVVRVRHRFPVDEHGGKRVQLLAHQHRPVRFQILFRDVEVAEPAPIALSHPEAVLFVRPFKRIFYGSVCHEVEIVA